MKPLGKKIQIEMVEEKIGAIQSDSVSEKGTVVAIGHDVPFDYVGRTLYFKAWAVDVITEDGKKFYFIDADSPAICAIKLQ